MTCWKTPRGENHEKHIIIDNSTYLIQVENVEAQGGVGSPGHVDIVASGTWADLCAQIAEVRSSIKYFQIDVTILASTTPYCRPDYLGLPFRFELPLNIVEMPNGIYIISVNGVSTALELPLQH